MFCRNDVSCRWVIQVFINNQTFVPCTMLDAHSAINTLVQMVVVIHAFLFVLCFIFPNSVISTIFQPSFARISKNRNSYIKLQCL
jgi:hypothetical protein